MKTTPIPVKFDRQGHSCNFYGGFGPTHGLKHFQSLCDINAIYHGTLCHKSRSWTDVCCARRSCVRVCVCTHARAQVRVCAREGMYACVCVWARARAWLYARLHSSLPAWACLFVKLHVCKTVFPTRARLCPCSGTRALVCAIVAGSKSSFGKQRVGKLKIFIQCNLRIHCKLTWLVLGGDPAARSHRVEQFTAL